LAPTGVIDIGLKNLVKDPPADKQGPAFTTKLRSYLDILIEMPGQF
jgi:hypothetical protein